MTFKINHQTGGADYCISQTDQELLEKREILRSPEYKRWLFNNTPADTKLVVDYCVGCGGQSEGDDSILQPIKDRCECLTKYAVTNAIVEVHKHKSQAIVEKFVVEVKR